MALFDSGNVSTTFENSESWVEASPKESSNSATSTSNPLKSYGKKGNIARSNSSSPKDPYLFDETETGNEEVTKNSKNIKNFKKKIISDSEEEIAEGHKSKDKKTKGGRKPSPSPSESKKTASLVPVESTHSSSSQESESITKRDLSPHSTSKSFQEKEDKSNSAKKTSSKKEAKKQTSSKKETSSDDNEYKTPGEDDQEVETKKEKDQVESTKGKAKSKRKTAEKEKPKNEKKEKENEAKNSAATKKSESKKRKASESESSEESETSSNKKQKKSSDSEEDKKAWTFFLKSKREEIKSKNPNVSPKEISQIASQMWKNCSDEEKKPFLEEAKKVKESATTSTEKPKKEKQTSSKTKEKTPDKKRKRSKDGVKEKESNEEEEENEKEQHFYEEDSENFSEQSDRDSEPEEETNEEINEDDIIYINNPKEKGKSPPKKPKTGTSRRIVSSGITSEHNAFSILKQNKILPDFSFSDRFARGTTHVVVPDKKPKRTEKILLGIAAGIWIISDKWVLDSMSAEKWLPEDTYEIRAFPGAAICRKAKKEKKPGIFDKMKFFFNGTSPMEKADLLIKLQGGIVLTFFNPDACDLVVSFTNWKPSSNDPPVVDLKWILDSIAQGKKMNEKNYLWNNEDMKKKEKDF